MDKEEFLARYHPDTRKVFKKEEQNTDLKERLRAASNDKRFSERERDKVRHVLNEAEKRGVFKEKVVIDRKEGAKIEKKLEEGFKHAFASGILKEPTREEVRRARGQ